MNKRTILLLGWIGVSVICFIGMFYITLHQVYQYGSTHQGLGKVYFFSMITFLFFVSSFLASGIWRSRSLILYKQIFERSNDAIAVISSHGEYMLQNHAHEKLLGWKSEELREIVPIYKAGEQKFLLVQQLERFKSLSGEFIVASRNQPSLDVSLSAYTIVDDFDETLFYVEVKRDIREFKAMEKKIVLAHESIQQSINYASRIQKSFLPSESVLSSIVLDSTPFAIKDFSLYWQPKDIIGGDCYWIESDNKGRWFFALIDCTGHGVPGAMMTFVVVTQLRQILFDTSLWSSPADMLTRLNRSIKSMLNQSYQGESLSDDGMDGAFLMIDTAHGKITYAGANIPLFVGLKDDIKEIKGVKSSIGYKSISENLSFENHEIIIEKGLTLYCSTDGIFDQIGGKKRMAFGKKRFQEIALSYHQESLASYQESLLSELLRYRGNEVQRDDNTCFALRF